MGAHLWYWPQIDYDRLDRCRRQVKADMVASGFQIGAKFDQVAERRARKMYRNSR